MAAIAAAGCGARGGAGVYLGLSSPPGTEVAVGRASLGAAGGGPALTIPNAPNRAQAGNTTAFCQDVEQLLTLFPRLIALDGRPATVAAIKALDGHFQKDAPADILPDITLVVGTNRRLVADLTASPVDVAGLARDFESPGYQLAVQQVGSYGFGHCQGG